MSTLQVNTIENAAGTGAPNFPFGLTTTGGENLAVDTITNAAGTGAPTFTNGIATASFVAPTVQAFLSGSGTYTPPSSPRTPLYLRVRAVAGGGGGSAAGPVNGVVPGTAGGNTTFGTFITCDGGAVGSSIGTGGVGGTVSVTTSSTVLKAVSIQGGYGSGGVEVSAAGTYPTGGDGGVSAFGGSGAGGGSSPGSSASPNSGSGGGGGGSTNQPGYGGGGGGAGGYVEVIITSPGSFAYSIGAAGSAGGSPGAGYSAGAAGGSGYIVVEEFYQ